MAKKDPADYTVEEKLKTLYELQTILSQIDKIKILRGELPLEVKDLEDEIVGLGTRIENIKNDINQHLLVRKSAHVDNLTYIEVISPLPAESKQEYRDHHRY